MKVCRSHVLNSKAWKFWPGAPRKKLLAVGGNQVLVQKTQNDVTQFKCLKILAWCSKKEIIGSWRKSGASSENSKWRDINTKQIYHLGPKPKHVILAANCRRPYFSCLALCRKLQNGIAIVVTRGIRCASGAAKYFAEGDGSQLNALSEQQENILTDSTMPIDHLRGLEPLGPEWLRSSLQWLCRIHRMRSRHRWHAMHQH
jgi:hypothetical protein